MKNKKNLFLTGSMFTFLFFLSGCVKTVKDQDGHTIADPNGLMYKTIVVPLGNFLTFLAKDMNWGYGVAIIIVTLVVRAILLPMMINQSKKGMIQAEKMRYIKPQLDMVQENMKKAKTREEQALAQMDMQKVYKENNMSMMGGIGCLPILIQLPVFSALYATVSYNPAILNDSFLGISLGHRSFIFIALAFLSYAAQSALSMVGIPEEQKKMMRSMMIVSPLMIVFMSWAAPAGVTLYWVIGGIIMVVQTFITNILMKPRIVRKIDEEMKKNPPKVVVTPLAETEEPVTNTKKSTQNQIKTSATGRNAGKQQRK